MTREGTFRVAVRKYGPFERAIEAQWAAFEADAGTGLALEMVALDLHALEEALFASNGMRDGAWDVAFVATDWIAAMHARGCAVDLAGMLREDAPEDYPEGWTDSLLRLQRVGEQVLGVPYHDGPECLMYRKDVFEDAGLAAPTTWSEFHEVARRLNRPDLQRYGTVFAAFPDGHNSVYDFLLQLWTRGGELFDEAGTVRFRTREAEEALSFYRAVLRDAEAVHPGSAGMDSVAAGMAFAAGEVAMMINWFGFATMAHTAENSAVRGLVEVAEIPAGGTGETASLNVYWILSVGQGSPHREVAWSFLRHTLTPEMDKLTTLSGAIGCRRTTWSDAEVNAAIPFYRRIERLHEHAREIPQRADWPEIAGVIDRLVTAAIGTDRAVGELLDEADAAVAGLKER
jgi:multiple sugar transport system substrate-binding protein